MLERMNARPTIHEPMLIGGSRISTKDCIEVRNPAHPQEVVGSVPRADANHVKQAIQAAKIAQRAWARKSYRARAEILEAALEPLASGLEERRQLFVRENGKTLAEAGAELAGVVPRQKFALSFAARLDQEQVLPAARGETYLVRRPYGVVVCIVPWNAPVSLAFTQVVAALLAGNSVVLKPPETCPLTLTQLALLFAARLPEGLLNVVTGLPSEIGDPLTMDENVAKIGFTGSIASAKKIMMNAAQGIKSVTLELGGNDPAIFLDDADFTSLEPVAKAVFSLAGQVCMAVKRIYVPQHRADEFLDRFCEVVDRTVVGDGLQDGVTMGPLHTQAALEKATAILSDAEQRGGQVRALGRIQDPATFDNGYFMRPAVVSKVPSDARLVVEEQFCAAVPVLAYTDLEEAIAAANDTHFGLSASVWSTDASRALSVARSLEAGQVWVNGHGVPVINHAASYGGIKQSGIGRRSGLEGITEFSQLQTVTSCA